MNSRFDNPFPYSDDNKRYHTYNYYLRHKFGTKVFKIPLNIDLGCPNRDGTKGVGGCVFCSAKMSGDFAGDPHEDILTQYREIREKMSKKWSKGLCIPYFQAGSNTYADVETLRKMFYTALSFENTAGLSIATRADCINEEKADLLGELAEKTFLTVELGLQTIHDETAKTLGQLDIQSIKIHLLHVLKGTVLAQMYERGEFRALEMYEYVNIVCDQLELLPAEIVIQRVTGDGAKDDLVAPLWSLKKFCVMNEIDKEMGRRNSWQGKALSE